MRMLFLPAVISSLFITGPLYGLDGPKDVIWQSYYPHFPIVPEGTVSLDATQSSHGVRS